MVTDNIGNSVPPNVKFVVDDVETPWGYEERPFDYIHARFLVGGIKDMPRLVEQSYKSVASSVPVMREFRADRLQLP